MSKTIRYGKINVVEIRESKRVPTNTVVKTTQSIQTEYMGDSQNFKLANALGLNKPITFSGARNNTQVIPNATPEQVKVAMSKLDISNARIILKEHETRQWDAQEPSKFTGKFYTTELDLVGVKVDAAAVVDAHIEPVEARPVVVELKPE